MGNGQLRLLVQMCFWPLVKLRRRKPTTTPSSGSIELVSVTKKFEKSRDRLIPMFATSMGIKARGLNKTHIHGGSKSITGDLLKKKPQRP
jgi:hypothetical protein